MLSAEFVVASLCPVVFCLTLHGVLPAWKGVLMMERRFNNNGYLGVCLGASVLIKFSPVYLIVTSLQGTFNDQDSYELSGGVLAFE